MSNETQTCSWAISKELTGPSVLHCSVHAAETSHLLSWSWVSTQGKSQLASGVSTNNTEQLLLCITKDIKQSNKHLKYCNILKADGGQPPSLFFSPSKKAENHRLAVTENSNWLKEILKWEWKWRAGLPQADTQTCPFMLLTEVTN